MGEYGHLCLGCMENKGTEPICPHCGWVEGSRAEAPQHLPPGTILHEKYLLGRVLGHGGFGITYLAWDLNLEMKLAIKEYMPRDFATRSPDQTMISVFTGGLETHFENGLKKFLDEAKTLAQFTNHPGIVGVRDFFRENGTAYLVMYYLEGIDFKQYLETQGGKIPFQTALSIMLPVMDALREVHKTGTLHRDISPDNIYITAKGQVKILDFGAARHAVSEFSKSISVILKPGYAPEEQYRSKGKQGPWTDIYAAAATFYRAIVGQVPPESLDRLEEDTIDSPTAAGVEIPQKAEAALLKALSVKSGDRYQSMEEFQQDLLPNLDVNIDPLVSDPKIEQIVGEKLTIDKHEKAISLEKLKKQKISKWVWIGGGAAVVAFITIGIFGVLFVLGGLADSKPEKPVSNSINNSENQTSSEKIVTMVVVPNVVNSLEENAKAALQKEGLKAGKITYVESLYASKGVVLKQSLQAGQKVNKNDVIHLEISKGINLAFDEETIKTKRLALVNEYWDKGYELNGQKDLEGALKYYTQARDMASILYFLDGDIDAQYSLGVLNKNVALVKRDLGYYNYALYDIQTSVLFLDDLLKRNPTLKADYSNDLASSYSELSYFQILNNRPEEAVISAEKALELNSNDMITNANLAHAYLFTNQYEAAQALYKKYQNEKVNDNQTFKDLVLGDFNYFKEIKVTHPDMDKIEAMYANENAADYSDEEEIQLTIYANGIAFEDEDVTGYMSTIDPNGGGYDVSEKNINEFFAANDNIKLAIDKIEVLEINGDTAKAKVHQTLSYSDGSKTYKTESTLIHNLVRSDGIYKWLISTTEVEGG